MYRSNVRIAGIAIAASTVLIGAIATAEAETWTLRHTVKPPQPGDGQRFGHSATLDGDLAAVMGWKPPDNLETVVYVYRRDDDESPPWIYEGALHTPPDPFPAEPELRFRTGFGWPVEIFGDKLVAAAYNESNHGTCSHQGAVYVYRRVGYTWQRVRRLVMHDRGGCPFGEDCPDDTQFGWGIAASNDLLAVTGAKSLRLTCGAPAGDYREFEVGVYLYDLNVANGAFITKLNPLPVYVGLEVGNPRANDVAVFGDVVAFSVPYYPPIDAWPGVVYVYRAPNWSRSEQVIPNPTGRWEDEFGTVLDLTEDALFVYSSGVVYVYHYNPDGERWVLVNTLCPTGDCSADIEVSGDMALISRNRTPPVVVVYNRDRKDTDDPTDDVWTEVDTLPRTQFGYQFDSSGDISGDTLLLGDVCAETNYGNTGAVRFYDRVCDDTDEDGLCDHWETDGIPFGASDRRYTLPDANPLRKDLYVEVDRMVDAPFYQTWLDKVETAFDNAPVSNPEPSEDGINLHIMVDFTSYVPSVAEYDLDMTMFGTHKELRFGTAGEWADPDWENPDGNDMRAAKLKAYRYCIVAKKLAADEDGDNPVGLAEMPGNDFIVAVGGVDAGDQPREFGITFMHELGHNLNLDEGGKDDVLFKPNYVSVMNYGFGEFVDFDSGDPLTLDFSQEKSVAGDADFFPLVENSLDETKGIRSSEYPNVATFYGVKKQGQADPSVRQQNWVVLSANQVDWDFSASISASTPNDLNWLPGSYCADEASPGQTHASYEDWEHIELPIGTDGDFASAVHNPKANEKRSEQMIAWLRTALPPLDCNTNSVLDSWDVLAGTSLDCNSNGIPDECMEWESDCNTNGVPDECDALAGTSTDCTGDGIPDECDPDCNVNGVPDTCDIAAGTSADCTGDGTPDECDPDCNTNGVPDSCDIGAATSADCNANAVPDECELTANDCNSNTMPDDCDILGSTSADCNGNTIPDSCDIAAGTSVDCSADGTPDECDPDCNVNGVPDSCDIAGATSQDCNANSVPDACDIALRFSSDCNANAVPDSCDVTGGTSVDCNTNGRPDACDTLDGTDTDCNTNGIPDSCDLLAGTSTDCNSNGRSDSCDAADVDCNANGWPDDCDVAAGTSLDCDYNGSPDECDLMDGDCNNNGFVDWCEVTAGTSPDCDGNGMPDSCDLATSDCNSNGIPDDCDVQGSALRWVSYVIDFSSQYGTSGYSASQALGEPDVFAYGDSPNAWCPSSEFGTFEFLTLGFDVPVITSGVIIRENVGNGFVHQVDVLDEDGVPHTVWSGVDPSAPGSVVDFEVNWPTTSFLVKGVKIYIDTDLNFVERDEIDAVRLRVPGEQAVQDCNYNGTPDECESPTDCNTNGVQDICDAAGGTSSDCNANEVPDECEAECNANRVPDDCDITGGTSADCNTNAVPDECDLASGSSPDCNTNGIVDECEAECNANLIPDACDISGGTSADCNANGNPDECDLVAAALSQWASYVIDFSSEWSSGSYSAAQALGEPNVFAYGDSPNAWCPSSQNGTLEFLTLGFDVPVMASGVTIRENLGNGFVYQVDVLDEDDVPHTVWTGVDPSAPGSVVDFEVNWPTTSFLVKGVKIYINTDYDQYAWEEIDAVQLHGLTQVSPDINSNGVPDECEHPGDCDADGDVDLDDFAELATCLEGPGGGLAQPSCNCFDLDTNGDVDLFDFAAFQVAFTGP